MSLTLGRANTIPLRTLDLDNRSSGTVRGNTNPGTTNHNLGIASGKQDPDPGKIRGNTNPGRSLTLWKVTLLRIQWLPNMLGILGFAKPMCVVAFMYGRDLGGCTVQGPPWDPNGQVPFRI